MYIHGKMDVCMLVLGKITIWMAMVCILGQTVVVIMDSTFKIKNTVMVFISGMMGACMKVFGSRENNTDKVNIYQKTDK